MRDSLELSAVLNATVPGRPLPQPGLGPAGQEGAGAWMSLTNTSPRAGTGPHCPVALLTVPHDRIRALSTSF